MTRSRRGRRRGFAMHSLRLQARVAVRNLWNVPPRTGSLGLEAGELHHLGPFFGFVGDEVAEVGGRARESRAAQVGNQRRDLGVSEGSVYLLVQLVDDFGGSVPGSTEAAPETCLETRQEGAQGRDLGQYP